jgi:hypothetical protein
VHFVVSYWLKEKENIVSRLAEIVPGKRIYLVLAVKDSKICCSGFQSGPYAHAHREPNQISKVPQENDVKLGSYRNFGVGHRNFTA